MDIEAFRGAFIVITDWCVLLIDVMALSAILIGTVEAFVVGLRNAVNGAQSKQRQAWLRYARWLVAGLTFLLAADIIETAIAPNWEEIGQVAAIAVVRTFLNFFLERDMNEARELDGEAAEGTGKTA